MFIPMSPLLLPGRSPSDFVAFFLIFLFLGVTVVSGAKSPMTPSSVTSTTPISPSSSSSISPSSLSTPMSRVMSTVSHIQSSPATMAPPTTLPQPLPSNDPIVVNFLERGSFLQINSSTSNFSSSSDLLSGSFEFGIKTSSQSALLFYVTTNPSLMETSTRFGKNFIAVEVINGHLLLSVNDGSGTVSVQSELIVNDGLWHNVGVLFSSSTLEISVDGKSRTLKPTIVDSSLKSRGKETVYTSNNLELDTVYIGGLDERSEFTALQQSLSSVFTEGAADASLIGCLKDIRINRKAILTAKMTNPVLKRDSTQDILMNHISTGPDCLWNFICLLEDPCIPSADCFQSGLSDFHCVCEESLCIREDYQRKSSNNLPGSHGSNPSSSLHPPPHHHSPSVEAVDVTTTTITTSIKKGKKGGKKKSQSSTTVQPPAPDEKAKKVDDSDNENEEKRKGSYDKPSWLTSTTTPTGEGGKVVEDVNRLSKGGNSTSSQTGKSDRDSDDYASAREDKDNIALNIIPSGVREAPAGSRHLISSSSSNDHQPKSLSDNNNLTYLYVGLTREQLIYGLVGLFVLLVILVIVVLISASYLLGRRREGRKRRKKESEQQNPKGHHDNHRHPTDVLLSGSTSTSGVGNSCSVSPESRNQSPLFPEDHLLMVATTNNARGNCEGQLLPSSQTSGSGGVGNYSTSVDSTTHHLFPHQRQGINFHAQAIYSRVEKGRGGEEEEIQQHVSFIPRRRRESLALSKEERVSFLPSLDDPYATYDRVRTGTSGICSTSLPGGGLPEEDGDGEVTRCYEVYDGPPPPPRMKIGGEEPIYSPFSSSRRLPHLHPSSSLTVKMTPNGTVQNSSLSNGSFDSSSSPQNAHLLSPPHQSSSSFLGIPREAERGNTYGTLGRRSATNMTTLSRNGGHKILCRESSDLSHTSSHTSSSRLSQGKELLPSLVNGCADHQGHSKVQSERDGDLPLPSGDLLLPSLQKIPWSCEDLPVELKSFERGQNRTQESEYGMTTAITVNKSPKSNNSKYYTNVPLRMEGDQHHLSTFHPTTDKHQSQHHHQQLPLPPPPSQQRDHYFV